MFEKIRVPFMMFAILTLSLAYYADTQNMTIKELLLPTQQIIRVDDVSLAVDIANTQEGRLQGLSGRSEIGTNEGMLFVFEKNDYHGIWMKNMNFPIDIIWIDENLNVVGVTGALPESYPKETYYPPEKVKYVLETNRYFAETFGIGEGSVVSIPQEYLELK